MMNVYIDISYIHYFFLLFIIKKEVSNILGIKSKDLFKTLILSLSFTMYFLDLSEFILVYLFITNLLINRSKKLFTSLLFIVLYLISPISYLLFKNHIYYQNYLILLTSIESIFILVFEFIIYKFTSFFLNKIILKFRMRKFVYNVELIIDKKSLKLALFCLKIPL